MRQSRVDSALRRRVALAVASLAVAALATAPPAYPQAPSARPKLAERVENLAGLKNVGRIAPGLYRGDEPSEEGLRTLKSMGIRTVINLRHHHGKTELRHCAPIGLDCVRIPLKTTDAPSDEDVRRFLAIVTDPARQPAYFHCWRGKDRTGAMAAVYRVVIDRWSADDALAEMEAFGTFKGFHDLRTYVRHIAAEPTLVWPPPPAP